MNDKLFVDKWFKLPPKIGEKKFTFVIMEAGYGRKSRKGIKKKARKKSG